MKKIKVHITDSHKLIREAFISLIDSQPNMKVSGDTANGIELIGWLSGKNDCDIIIFLDLKTPDGDGFEIQKYIHGMGVNAKMIDVTFYDNFSVFRDIIHLKEDSYILKTEVAQTIVRAINDTYAGKKFASGAMKNNLINIES